MSRRFVLDASFALAWCFADEATALTARSLDGLADDSAVVPHLLWELEVWNALLVANRRGRIPAQQLESNREFLAQLPLRRQLPPLADVFALARRYELSSYDAVYLALALHERLPLATLDERLGTAAAHSGVTLLADA